MKKNLAWQLPAIVAVVCLLVFSTLWFRSPKVKEEPSRPKEVVAVDYAETRATWAKECISLLSSRGTHDRSITTRCNESAFKLYPAKKDN